MQQSEQEILLTSLGATAEIMGNQLQPAALMLMAEDLSKYSLQEALTALRRCRHEVTGRLTLAAIIDRIQSADGMPGADEAWAIMSRPEDDTIVITEEMAEAMQYARPLLATGDKTGARMAYKDAYSRLVNDSRDKGLKPKWFISIGHDKSGRAGPVAEGIRTGKLDLNCTLYLLSPEAQVEVLQLTGNHNHPLFLEHKQAQIEEQKPFDTQNGLKRIADIKRQLAMRTK